MKFSEFFRFLIILHESIKLLPKNWKLMASIAILSHIPPSILFLLFSSSFQFWTSYIRTSPFMLVFVLEIAFFLVFITISHLSTFATILVSATSYSGNNLSFVHMLSSIKGTWRRPLLTSFQVSRSSSEQYLLIFVPLTILLVIGSPNPITISIALFVGITFAVLHLYSSVVWALSLVVSIVEEGVQGREAVEKAAEVVEGQRLHGFMLNLCFSLLLPATVVISWMVLGDKGSLNLTIYGLIVLNFTSFVKMLLFMAYTVFYFQCKQQHGEEIEMFGYLQHTKLPISYQQTGE